MPEPLAGPHPPGPQSPCKFSSCQSHQLSPGEGTVPTTPPHLDSKHESIFWCPAASLPQNGKGTGMAYPGLRQTCVCLTLCCFLWASVFQSVRWVRKTFPRQGQEPVRGVVPDLFQSPGSSEAIPLFYVLSFMST